MMWCLHNFDKDKRSKTSQLKFYLKIWQVKNSLGIKFEEIRLIFDKLKVDGMFDVYLNTCHVFAVHYDLWKEGGC